MTSDVLCDHSAFFGEGTFQFVASIPMYERVVFCKDRDMNIKANKAELPRLNLNWTLPVECLSSKCIYLSCLDERSSSMPMEAVRSLAGKGVLIYGVNTV